MAANQHDQQLIDQILNDEISEFQRPVIRTDLNSGVVQIKNSHRYRPDFNDWLNEHLSNYDALNNRGDDNEG